MRGKPELDELLDEELLDELDELGLTEPELDELEDEVVVIFSEGTKQPVNEADNTASARGLSIK
ncbi:MAG: hypothetical protein RL497_1434 [Pseudomonadota bacterium]